MIAGVPAHNNTCNENSDGSFDVVCGRCGHWSQFLAWPPAYQQGRYKIRNGTERRNRTNKTISCIRKVIKFVEYIPFQLRRLPTQFINMHNVHLAQ